MNRDGDGFLLSMDDWSEEVMKEMATTDGFDLTDQILEHITIARQYYDDNSVVPPIRKFSKEVGSSSKELYEVYHGGPMKIIAKYGGLPKPTGCV